MKNLKRFLMTALLLFANVNVFSTIWHVNNVGGLFANFTTIQAATVADRVCWLPSARVTVTGVATLSVVLAPSESIAVKLI